jgi:hypothetical protein
MNVPPREQRRLITLDQIHACLGTGVSSPTVTAPRSLDTRDPPFCADVSPIPIRTLAVQIWIFCVSTGDADGDRRSIAGVGRYLEPERAGAAVIIAHAARTLRKGTLVAP